VCGVSKCDRETFIMRMPWPTMGCCAVDIIIIVVVVMLLVLLYDITKFRAIYFSYSDLSFEGNLAVDRSQETFLSLLLHN